MHAFYTDVMTIIKLKRYLRHGHAHWMPPHKVIRAARE
jgi:hypothetical protein